MSPEDGTPLDVAVAELAERQFGVVSLAQLRALGLGARGVRHRVRAGRLRRLHRGVYAVGHGVLRPEGRRMAAVLACGEGAVLSHTSAAAHWGLLQSSAARLDVTAALSREGAPGIRLHRSRALEPPPVRTQSGPAASSKPGSWRSSARRGCRSPW